MAAISDNNIKRKIVSFGPFKVEFVWSTTTVGIGDFTSDLQNPTVAIAGTGTGDENSLAYATTAVGSKTVTLAGTTVDADVSIMVIGF